MEAEDLVNRDTSNFVPAAKQPWQDPTTQMWHHAPTLHNPNCIVHSVKWRGAYQHILNLARNIIIPVHYISGVSKVICICEATEIDSSIGKSLCSLPNCFVT